MEAARIDGASSLGVLLRVLVPYGRPAILTMVVLVFMWTWNEFLLSLVMLSGQNILTAPLSLAFFQSQRTTDIQLLAAASIIVAFPVLDRLRRAPASLHPRHGLRIDERLIEMASVTYERAVKHFGDVDRPARAVARDPRRRVHGPRRSVRLRQDDRAQAAGRSRGPLRRAHPHRRRARRRHGTATSRHRDGLSGLCALPADVRAGQPCVRPQDGQGPPGRDPSARRRGSGGARHRRAPRPEATRALRWPASARCPRSRARPSSRRCS